MISDFIYRMKLLLFLQAISLLISCPAAHGFFEPSQKPLPDFDSRSAQSALGAFTAADQQQAVRSLKTAVPGVRVVADPILVTPQYVGSTTTFLTRPKGAVVGLAPQALAAVTDSDAPIKNFINQYPALFGQGSDLLKSTVVKTESVSPQGGMHQKIWEQQLDGVPVFEGELVANTTSQGQLISVSSRVVPNILQVANASVPNHAIAVTAPPLAAAEAVARAAQNVGEQLTAADVTAAGQQNGWKKFTAPGLAREAIVRLTWLPLGQTSLSLCWEVWVTDRAKGHQYQVLIDAQSRAVKVRRFMTRYLSNVTYNVYTAESPTPMLPGCSTPCTTQPSEQPRQLLTLSAVSTNASPNGWINDVDNVTTGNNVVASVDLNGDEVPDLPYTAGTSFRVFNYPLNLTQPPAAYSDAAVVQFFFYLNKAHDVLWEAGFNEAAGNMQGDNFGRGGLGGDPLLANAQSVNAVNNAFCNPAPDGTSPSLNMGLFTSVTPNRDSDLDQMVALHEMFHAVSDRLDGGIPYANNYQSGGMQEGWSDFASLVLNVPPGVDPDGTYPTGGYLTYQLMSGFTQNYYFGIRRYPYCTDLTKNPLTYKDIDSAQASSHTGVPISPLGWEANGAGEVHNPGEVWCNVLWEMRVGLVKALGDPAGNARAIELVIDGLKLLRGNSGPSFLDARDAILQADLANNGGANQSIIWTAFAKRGMGAGARSPNGNSTAGVVEAYDLPDDLQVSPLSGLAAIGAARRTVHPGLHQLHAGQYRNQHAELELHQHPILVERYAQQRCVNRRRLEQHCRLHQRRRQLAAHRPVHRHGQLHQYRQRCWSGPRRHLGCPAPGRQHRRHRLNPAGHRPGNALRQCDRRFVPHRADHRHEYQPDVQLGDFWNDNSAQCGGAGEQWPVGLGDVASRPQLPDGHDSNLSAVRLRQSGAAGYDIPTGRRECRRFSARVVGRRWN